MKTHEISGNKIFRVFNAGTSHEEREIVAYCDEPGRALELMQKAWALNDQRRYTASARLLAKVETLAGFGWPAPADEADENHAAAACKHNNIDEYFGKCDDCGSPLPNPTAR